MSLTHFFTFKILDRKVNPFQLESREWILSSSLCIKIDIKISAGIFAGSLNLRDSKRFF